MIPEHSLFLSLAGLCNGGSSNVFSGGPYAIVSFGKEPPSGINAETITLPKLTKYQTEYLKQRLNIQKNGPIILISDGLLADEYVVFGDAEKTHTDNGLSLAENLTDVLAVSIVSEAEEDDESLQAMSWVKNKRAVLKAAIEKCASSQEPSDFDLSDARDFFSQYKFIVQEAKDTAMKPRRIYVVSDASESVHMERSIMPGLPSPKKNTDFIQIRPRDPYEIDPNLINGAEKESGKQFLIYGSNLKSRKKLNRMWRSYQIRYKDFDWFDEEYCSVEDYSNEGACLGKIVEEEVNASIVQLIRQVRFEIEMPRYWRRYDQTKHDTCVVNTKKIPVAFNFMDRKRNALRSVPIGQLYSSIETLLAEDEKYESALGVFAEVEFIRRLTGFSYFRNDSSHPGGLSADDFKEMHRQFTELLERYMQELVILKKRLKA